ncbi:MAG TPA: formate dehydrogenase accessory sulfurtransferase FdhD [Methanocella sp.]|uniref:formate dehydrogenase accessory sulfurtransferase FdhD n=1 Tax=Methanocella sp. TaxID=2052833 RepID=UPI002BC3542F|nr:formate dehydrogenase accessory sulfurtransferase FdhD [Methanocella sp.]HTY90451.1 formate dehydrogenase accessory sulfurtransferase FdhD [Methanocella sp.]
MMEKEKEHDAVLRDITASYHAVGIDRDTAHGIDAEVCVEDSVNLLINGTRVASLTITPADLEAFARGYLVCEGLIRSVKDIRSIDVQWPNVDVSVPSFGGEDADLWVEIRSSGCVGVKASWSGLEEPIASKLSVSKDTIFYSLGFINELASNWKKTGGMHCTIIFDAAGGIVSYAEDIGRHNSMDKAVGKALIQGRDLSRCFIVCTGRMAGGMVAKAYRAGVPILISNTAPFSTGIDLARQLNMTLVCFARPPRMLVYSGKERISGISYSG